ncbi:hypothetical protein HK104_005406 [Borealophlyctis nickersoniae]|nr:hypothetical protein HK104_005406 [Borealophlyctis nickersoniae]
MPSDPSPNARDPASVAARAGDAWYTDAAEYWESVPATVDGMLGGFGSLTAPDVACSKRFIDEFVNGKKDAAGNVVVPPRIGRDLACDCGAGIGRVSKYFLLDIFAKVDLVEQNAKFLEEAKGAFLGGEWKGRVEKFLPVGLQSFVPEEGRYDLIWCQWVLSHLSDEDLVAFLQRCKKGVKSNGLIGVKENVTSSGADIDSDDSSVTRSDAILKGLFEQAGLRIVKQDLQTGFPQGLYAVQIPCEPMNFETGAEITLILRVIAMKYFV